MRLVDALPLTCLTALTVSCAGLKKFPTDRIYEFDPKTPICAEYKIVNYEKLQYKWVQDIPFEKCPAIFGFKAEEIPKVLDWTEDAIAYSKRHCKQLQDIK